MTFVRSAALRGRLRRVAEDNRSTVGTRGLFTEAVEEIEELEEALTVATDTAIRRGEQLDAIRARFETADWEPDSDGNDWALVDDILAILDEDIGAHWQGGHPWSVDGG